MFFRVLELSKRASKAGRVHIKIALHKIHDDPDEVNKNGLHWEKQYVENSMESAIGIPICAEFLDDDKEIPFGHGYTEQVLNPDGTYEPIFENSIVVGDISKVAIEEINIDGENILALTGEGDLFKQRYPKFVDYIRKKFASNQVLTSVEVMGLKENDGLIVYEEDEPTVEKRTCKEYEYSGVCILGVEPADDNAVVMELSQSKPKQEENIEKEGEINMEFTEEMRAAVNNAVTDAIKELNNKEAVFQEKEKELNVKIDEMNSVIAQKDSEIAQKDSEICEKNKQVEELNASTAALQATLDQMKKDHETYWEEREILERELAQAKVAEKVRAMEDAIGVFNSSELEACKEDIETCRKSIEECTKTSEVEEKTTEINSLVQKIYAAIGKAAKANNAALEANSVKNNAGFRPDDIFSEIIPEVDPEKEHEVSIF